MSKIPLNKPENALEREIADLRKALEDKEKALHDLKLNKFTGDFIEARDRELSNGKLVANQFGSVRICNEYESRGFFLSGASDHVKWKIVEDYTGAQILIPDLEK